MKKLIILITILFNLTGCWNYKELNEIAITTGVAIDKENDEYLVTLMIANSKKQGSGGNDNSASTVVYTGTGKTIYEALKDAALSISKETYLGHIEVIILSKEIAQEGTKDIIDFLFRYPQTRNQFYLLVADGCKASDVFKVTIPLESFPSQNIAQNLEKTSELQGYIYSISFNEFVNDLMSEGIDPILPTITVIGEIEEGNKEENVQQNEPSTYLKLGMMAIFKDDKLLNISNNDQSIGINIINNKIDTLILESNYKDGLVVTEVKDSKASFEFDLNNEIPKLKINIEMTASLYEITNDVDLKDKNIINEISNTQIDKVNYLVNEAIKYAKENQTDIFGLGNKIYKKNYKYWYDLKEKWENEIFPQIEIEVNTKIDIKTKGATINTIGGNYGDN